jgi:hypothetical protein
MTDADVAAMVGGGKPAVAGRIATHSPTKGLGTLKDAKTSPPRITAAEAKDIRRTGLVPPRVRERLEKAADSDVPPEPSRSRKSSPTIDPKRASKG